MSDFDAVLERLVTEPAFKAALAADPDAVLHGYRLSADEVDLLRSQVSADPGANRGVEERTSKASMAGFLAPLAALSFGSDVPTMLARGVAPAPHEHFGPNVTSGFSPVGEQGAVYGGGASAELAAPGGHAGELAGAGGTGPAEAPFAGGPTVETPTVPPPVEASGHTGGTIYGGGERAGVAGPGGPGDGPATGYHSHVDADGDGRWDSYVAVRHGDGSVDVYEDRNRDGRIDFVGHDANGDGILNSAEYDNNFDGKADAYMTDTNGDGWMDTRDPRPSGR
jgi:hypothetical protein